MNVTARRNYIHIIYSFGVTVLGLALLLKMFGDLDLDRSTEFAALILLGILIEWLAVNFPLGRLSGGFSLVLGTLLIYNLSASAWISSVAFFVGNGIANRENPIRTSIFNMAQHVLTLYASVRLANMLWDSEMGGLTLTGPKTAFLHLITAIVLYFAINHFLVYIYTYPGRKGTRMHSWQDTLRWDALSYLFSAPFGVVMSVLYQAAGISAALLLFIPVLTVQFVLGLYVRSELLNKELRAVYEINKRLAVHTNIHEIPAVLLKEMHRAISFHTGIIYLWQEESRSFIAAAAYGPYREQLENGIIHTGEGFWGWVIGNGEPEIIFDSKVDPRVKSEQGLSQVLRSLLLIPLVGEAGSLGLVIIGEKKAMVFSEQDLQVAMSLCGTLTAALSNKLLSERLERRRSQDLMTGLLNRKHFYQSGCQVFQGCMPEEEGNIALVLVDVDILGHINEGWGQEQGDSIITELGRVIRGLNISGMLASRYADDEFALLLPGFDEEKALNLAAEIRNELLDLSFSEDYPLLRIKVSMGIAVLEDGENFEKLLQAAGTALKAAKKSGRDRVETASRLRGRYKGRSNWITST